MYLGVDVGGTKTLVAVLNSHGEIRERNQFPTPKNYDHWTLELRHTLAHFVTKDFKAAGIGIPATVLDRTHGRGISFGNLPWRNVPVQHDLEQLAHCPVVVENDAKLAGLSEAMLLKERYQRVLYVTISTGIGYGFIDSQKIDTEIGDGGGRLMLIEHHGRRVPWETFASGQAIVSRFGKKAADIHDEKTWQIIARDLASGLIELIAVTEPEVIVFGGSVGHYFERFHRPLTEALTKYHLPLVRLPKLIAAQRPEEAVVFGCYDLAKQTYAHANATA